MKMAYKTEGNLQEAFGGESKANRRYLFFADKAEKEGHPGAARLFRAVAEAETIHARNHFNVQGGVGTTLDNLMAASIGEHQEFTSMYPIFIDDARAERNGPAQRSFEWANAVEKAHHALFEAALAEVKAGKSPEVKVYHVCTLCGYTVAGQPPDKCPVCGAAAPAFKKME
jgi:rubrerythrin